MTRPIIGFDMLHYAELLEDTELAVAYDTPIRVVNAVSISINPNTSIETFFADDGPAEAASQIGEVDVSIQVADLVPEDYAFLTGAVYDNHTGMMRYATDAVAPEVAVGGRMQKSNGAYRYMWLYKGRFGLPEITAQTKESGINYQTQTINAKFLARIFDRNVLLRLDSDDTNVVISLPDDFFAAAVLV